MAEIWAVLAARRKIARTTVLTFVQRLEQRGWLKRLAGGGPVRYVATRGENEATEQITAEFVEEFFSGSATKLMMNLLGSHELESADIDRLRQALDAAACERSRRERQR